MRKHPELRVNFINLSRLRMLWFAVLSLHFVLPVSVGWPQEVVNGQLRVQWTENGDWLWYRTEAAVEAAQTTYIKVDARTGDKFPLFEPNQLSAALRNVLQGKISPEELERELAVEQVAKCNVTRLHDDGATFEFRLSGKTYQTNSAYEVKTIDETPIDGQSLSRMSRSRSSDRETNLQFVNQLDQPVTCFWLSTTGESVPYQTMDPGQTFEQHTFVDHVWSLRSADGTELMRIAASDERPDIIVNQAALEAFKSLPDRPNRESRRGRRGGGMPRSNPADERVQIDNYNLWIVDADGARKQLTHDGTAEFPYRGRWMVSPSGKYLAAMQTKLVPKREISIVESSPDAGGQPVVHTFEYVKPGDELDQPQLKLFNLESMTSIEVSHELMSNPWDLSFLDWTDDPERILCLYNERGHQRYRVLAVDPRDGAVQAIVDEHSPTFIDYAHKTFVQLVNGKRELLWASERSGYNRLYRYSTQDGQLLNEVTPTSTDVLTVPAPLTGSWIVREIEQVDEPASQVWFSASGLVPGEDPYYQHLCRVNMDGTGFVKLTNGDGDHRWEFSPDRRFIIDRYSRVDMPTVTTVRRTNDGSLVCELECGSFAEPVKAWDLPERFVAKGRDGVTDIYGVIVRPDDFDPKQKYPIVEKIYAGPQSAYVPKSFSPLRQEREVANMGCIVVLIDGMGTSHRGKAFHDVCWKNLADAGFPDRIAWIKAAAEKYPYMDLTRVGLFGGSAGGQNAMRALLDHNDFYRVAVADCGCHDNRMDKIWWNEAWMGWPIDESYARSSNVDDAHKLEGKLLLIVGELDRNVDPASTMQVVDALVKADKDFELLIIPGAGHGAAETRYGSKRRADFLREHLIGRGAE